MGLLGRLLGSEKERAPLDPGSEAARRIASGRAVLEAFVARLHDKVEIVPGETTWVFIGKPPDAFGIVWFQGAEEHNLKRLMADRKLPQARIQAISEELRAAYVRTEQEARFGYELGGKKVTVTPSAALEAELVRIIHQVE
jgi:hypothetical protein